MLEISKYKSFAKVQLKGRLKVPALMVLISFIITYAFSIPELFLPDTTKIVENFLITGESNLLIDAVKQSLPVYLILFVLSIVSTIIGFVLRMGELNVYVKMTETPETVSFKNYFQGLKNWIKGIKTGLWTSLWIILWSLIPAAVSVLSITLLYFSGDSNTVLGMFLGFISIILMLASLVPVVIKAIQYSQAFYFAAEFKNIGAIRALQLSKIITKNHIADLLLLKLSFMGWYLLIFATTYIPFTFLQLIAYACILFYLTPYITLTSINAFHALIKEAVSKGTVNLEELGVNPEN